MFERNNKDKKNIRGSLVNDFTSGNIPKQLVIFSAPLFFSNLLQVVYNIVDMIVVGQSVGSIGLSAISVGGDVFNFMAFLAMGFSNAGQVIIAQYIGAKEEDHISGFVGTMFTFLLSCAVAISVVVLIFRNQILSLMNTPPESWNEALAYVTICTAGMFFVYGYNILCAVLRGVGDSRHPFIFISLAAILNVFLDLVFVMGFGWGASGAALATIISQTLSFLLGITFLYRNRESFYLEFTLSSFRIKRNYLSLLVKLGVPMAIKSAAVSFSKMFVNSWINSYGVIVSAVSGVANKLNMIATLFSDSVTTAGSTMVGQNIGAEKYKRVSKVMLTTFLLDIALMAILCILLVSFPEQIFHFFSSDTSILPVAMEFVPVGVLMFVSSAFRAPMNTLLNGSGNYRINFVVAILDGLINRIGFGLLFGLVLDMKYVGFWLGDAVAGFTPFIVGGIFYLSGKWKTRRFVIKP